MHASCLLYTQPVIKKNLQNCILCSLLAFKFEFGLDHSANRPSGWQEIISNMTVNPAYIKSGCSFRHSGCGFTQQIIIHSRQGGFPSLSKGPCLMIGKSSPWIGVKRFGHTCGACRTYALKLGGALQCLGCVLTFYNLISELFKKFCRSQR